jgi:predicted component of type VI protein secretion system
MNRPPISPDQLVGKLKRVRLDAEKAHSQANRAFNRFIEEPADEQRLNLWEKAIDRLGDLAEEESRLSMMCEEWKAILNEEQDALTKEIDRAYRRAAELTERHERNKGHLTKLYFG